MHAELNIGIATLYGFLMALARVSGMVAFTPIPGLRDGPEAARIVFALALTFALMPAWPSPHESNPTVAMLMAWAAAELVVGLLIGLAISILFEAFQLAAQMIGLHAGFSYASTIDPSTQADSSVLQVMIQLFGGFLFFTFGLHRQVIEILFLSFKNTPLGNYSLTPQMAEAMIRLGSGIFTTALRLALPVVALMVLIDTSIAVLGRVQAQLQLISLSFLLKLLAGMGMLASAIAFYPAVFGSSSRRILAALAGYLDH